MHLASAARYDCSAISGEDFKAKRSHHTNDLDRLAAIRVVSGEVLVVHCGLSVD